MAEPTRIRLRVSPGSSTARVVGRYGEAWKVSVAAAPENGRANDAVLRLLASTLDLPRRDVTLVSGPASRDKVVAVAGITAGEAERRLGSAAGKRETGAA